MRNERMWRAAEFYENRDVADQFADEVERKLEVQQLLRNMKED